MWKRGDKRGLSDVVTTLIIILLSLVAIGIVWIVVQNLLSEGTEDIGLEQFSIDVDFVSASIDGNNVTMTVRRTSGQGNMTGMKFILSDGLNSEEFSEEGGLTALQLDTFTVVLQSLNPANLETAEVAPVYRSSGGNDVTGPITDTYTFVSGSSGGSGNENGGGGEEGGCGDGICSIDEDEINCQVDCTTASGEICGDGVCMGEETGEQCPADCVVPESCNGTWEGEAEDEGVECETRGALYCGYNCVCAVGFGGNGAGQCVLDPPVNSGVIFTVWNDIYFDSNDLPKSVATMSAYIDYYVNFSNSPETACFQITFADYVTSTDISYLRLDDAFGFPNIASEENYSVWEAFSCGQY